MEIATSSIHMSFGTAMTIVPISLFFGTLIFLIIYLLIRD